MNGVKIKDHSYLLNRVRNSLGKLFPNWFHSLILDFDILDTYSHMALGSVSVSSQSGVKS